MVHALRPPPPAHAPRPRDAPSSADQEALRFIHALGAEAKQLLDELARSPGHRTIDDQSTSESMSPAEFAAFSRSSKFSSRVLRQALAFARGRAKRADARLSAAEQARLAQLEGDLRRALMRSKDSALTAGERHQASTALAETILELQAFVNTKAVDALAAEGKKALEGAKGWLERTFGPR